jgi:hypothetical protein
MMKWNWFKPKPIEPPLPLYQPPPRGEDYVIERAVDARGRCGFNLGVLVSELATTHARNREDAIRLAAGQVEGYADAIQHQFPVSADAQEIFLKHVKLLKSLVESTR